MKVGVVRAARIGSWASGIVLYLWASVAWADAERFFTLPTADTEALRFGADYRGAARARFGHPLPLVGRAGAPGLHAALRPLLELYNDPDPDGFLPSENFRAKIGVDLGKRWQLGRSLFDVTLALEHESDHTTSRFDRDARPWFLSLNDLAVELSWLTASGPFWVQLGSASRLYVATCTELFACHRSLQGQVTWGASLDGTLTTRDSRWGLRPYLALHGAFILPRGEVVEEKRFVIHGGVFRRAARTSWELYWSGFLGNDVGFDRGRTVMQMGVGVRLWLAGF